SSRRRHTRFSRDWSSDVCSSDLLAVVELLDGTHQTGVALLDQVEQRQAAARVTARDGDDQPEVGADEDVLGPLAVVDQGLELLRSEERRVGKECRARWWAEH